LPVAVVTGASSGIGAAVARELGRRGWHGVLLARNEERLRAVAAEIGGEYELCDVGDRQAVEEVATRVLERHPEIRLLVNNAGFSGRTLGKRRGFVDADPDRLEQLFRVNFLGAVWCLRAFMPGLRAARASHVVNVASVAGTVAVPPGPYAASKHALVAFSRALAATLPRDGIRVHTVNPGLVETPGFPQRGVVGDVLERTVVEPEYVARRIVGAVERNRPEIFVPGWYRVPAIVQWLVPGRTSSSASSRVEIAPAARSSSTSASSRPISGPGGRPSSSPRRSGSAGSFVRASSIARSSSSPAPRNSAASCAHGSVARRKRKTARGDTSSGGSARSSVDA
jgi:short-subunit dehydrogenase